MRIREHENKLHDSQTWDYIGIKNDNIRRWLVVIFHKPLIFMVSPARIERAAYSLGGCRSILLSYRDTGIYSYSTNNFLSN